jgi:rRNA pseudouridine-1189 N-methylase Emg1 (Nep1/Mra1 family)
MKKLIKKPLYPNYSEYIMTNTTIQLEKEIVESLKEIRQYPRQTYNELIKNMIQVFKNVKQNNQYDEFLHKIQQNKMRELWDNKDDDEWNTL